MMELIRNDKKSKDSALSGSISKKHWFHLSTTLDAMEEEIYLEPKESGDNRSIDESGVPRICVSDTITRCFAAISCMVGQDSSFKSEQTPCYVFVTKTMTDAYRCEDEAVTDRQFTNEHWIVNPSTFVLVGRLSCVLCSRLNKNSRGSMVNCGGTHSELTAQRLHFRWICQLFRKCAFDCANEPWTSEEIQHHMQNPLCLDIKGKFRSPEIILDLNDLGDKNWRKAT